MKRGSFFSKSSVFPYDVLLFAVNVFAAVSPWIFPFVHTEEGYRGFFLTILSVNMATLPLLLSRAAQHERNAIDEGLASHGELLRGRIASWIRDDEFYVNFIGAIDRATSFVYISYLARTSPGANLSAARRDYDKRLLRAIRRKDRVRFRRLLRDTPSNREWLRDFLPRVNGRANVDIALLPDVDADEMPHALSVQVIDGHLCWFVAIESHDRVGEYRDLQVESAQVAEALVKYYDRLWAKAHLVMRSGVLETLGREITERHV